jgi:GNAT superfamily N-acetyltransferase
MDREIITVRRLSPTTGEQDKDWRAVYDLCCRTGNNGAPIAADRWTFFGRYWVGPYQKLIPGWTYLAENDDKAVGYLTGCPDTRAFAKLKFYRFSLPLLLDVFRRRYSVDPDVGRFIRQFFGLERGPEQRFPARVRRKLNREYPAHLHVNVDARWRNLGVGTKLLEQFISDLRSAGIPGVHLYCGAEPLKFYVHCGFNKLAKVIFRGASVYALGLRLQKQKFS